MIGLGADWRQSALISSISTSARRHTMRFYEFATPARPVLKISQPAQASASANTPATPLPQNTPPTAVPAEPVRVYPRQWQRAWLQKYLAAQMAKSARMACQLILIAELNGMGYFQKHGVTIEPLHSPSSWYEQV